MFRQRSLFREEDEADLEQFARQASREDDHLALGATDVQARRQVGDPEQSCRLARRAAGVAAAEPRTNLRQPGGPSGVMAPSARGSRPGGPHARPPSRPQLEHEQRPEPWHRSPLRGCDAQPAAQPRPNGPGSPAQAASGARTSSSNRSPSGPRNQSPIGTAKPILGRSTCSAGMSCFAIARSRTLRVPAVHLALGRQPRDELDELMIEQRRPGLERVRHRGPIHLHQQVLGQVGEQVRPKQSVDRIEPGQREARRAGTGSSGQSRRAASTCPPSR